MKKGRIISALLSIFMMLVSNTLRADDVISQFRILGGSTWPEGGAMLIRLDKYDYLLAGSGVVVDFKTHTEKNQERQKQLGEDGFAEAGTALQSSVSKFTCSRLGLLSVDEVTIDHQGQMQFLRRHNGDQSHQGRHARISIGEWKILHIQLYEYK